MNIFKIRIKSVPRCRFSISLNAVAPRWFLNDPDSGQVVEFIKMEYDEKLLKSYHESLLISDLDWTPEEVAETRTRLAACEEDWNAAGMDDYDKL